MSPSQPPVAEWTRASGPESDVVLSSRVRLARNIAGIMYPGAAKDADRRRALAAARDACLAQATVGVGGADRVRWIDLTETRPLDRMALVERHLISKQHAKGAEPRGVAVSEPSEWLSIMANEEDHLRIQVIRSGLALSDALERADTVDDQLESRLDYAYSARWGYLTACPTNVGTGLRVSVMLHLPAMRVMQQVDKLRRAAKAMNLAVRGFYGEGSDIAGDLYQISNQATFGVAERDILAALERDIVPEFVGYERHAREALMKKRRLLLEDLAYRALGALRYARLLSAEEALQHLSALRLGVETGVIRGVAPGTINELLLLVQPAHLQLSAGRDMDQAERRIARAAVVRDRLGADS